jgi:D-3-phosphoglycerate dehydrogenase
VARLQSGAVRGAVLDVLDNEKLATLTPAQQATFDYLRAAPNVLLSPHIGGWTHQSYQRINEVLVAKIEAVLGA